MTVPARLPRRQRLIRKIVTWLVALLYERVEVHQPPGETAGGPEVGVSNHFGGFADPILLAYAMDRLPRFVARDVIWRYPLAKQVLDWAGAIPVHKREDAGPASDNRAMFRSTTEALRGGDLVVIFPEGITVDDPSIARVKTGAARIALGARSDGVPGLEIIPAGIHYEDKASLRSKVFVNIGHRVDLDAWLAQRPEAESERDTVVALTEQIELLLRQTAPNYVDWQEAKALADAAEVAIRNSHDRDVAVGYAERERIAARLSRAGAAEKAEVIDAMTAYRTDLDGLGIGDRAMYAYRGRPRGIVRNVVATLLVGVVLFPFALVGLSINLLPMALLWLVGRLRMAPAMFATVKPLAAVVFFGAAWGVQVWSAWRAGGADWAAVSVLLQPFFLFALIAVVERGVRLWRTLQALGRFRRTRSMGEVIYAHRTRVVEAVAAAL